MAKKKVSVVIVGAGPAGISTALHLKLLGIDDILLVDKAKFPRYKCCAGYITNKTKIAYEKFGLDIKKNHYTLIRDFNIYYKQGLKQKIDNQFLYTNRKIDRVELDYSFFKLAKEKEITIWEEEEIVKHGIEKKSITFSKHGEVEYEFLVFADGTLGYGSRYQKIKHKNIAMQVTFPSKMEEQIDIHFGITKMGYAWVSSTKGTTNVGITDFYRENVNYREIFTKFLKDLHLECDEKEIKGAFTPIGVRKGVIHGNIYYVGDAVGACDPLTLSGLRYGLKSGEVCARAIFKNNNYIYKRYVGKLKVKFLLMSILQKIFYWKWVLFLIFNVGCRIFKRIIAFVFNHFFVNKK